MNFARAAAKEECQLIIACITQESKCAIQKTNLLNFERVAESASVFIRIKVSQVFVPRYG